MRFLAALLAIAVGCFPATHAGAQALPTHEKPKRPLIFIPGIAGSELWLNGKRAWGSAEGLLNLEDLRIPDGPRSVPPAPTCDPNNARAEYRASCGTINQFVVLGPFKVDVYGPLYQYLETLGYTRFGSERNLFVFSYDWRRSNFDTAAGLDAFVRRTPELAGKEIDILAHSMGGLVSLIYTNRYDAPIAPTSCDFPRTCRVKTVVTMGTPFWGSVSAVSTPVLGWGWLSRRLTGGRDAIARTVLSWPSLYELLPTHEGCCTISDRGTQRPLDLLKPSDFMALPFDLDRNGPAAPHVAEALKSASELKKLAATGFPNHVRNASVCPGIPPEGFFAIAGDRTGTHQSVAVNSRNMTFADRRGDGTVLLRSASIGNPAGAFLSFVPHMTIFNDENVKAKLETILFRCEMRFKDFKGEIPAVKIMRSLMPPEVLPIDFVSAEIVEIADGPANAFNVQGSLSLTAPEDAVAPKVLLNAKLNGTEFYRTEVASKSRQLDGVFTRFEYEHGPITVTGEGRVDVEMRFGDDGPTAADQAYITPR